MSLSESLVNTIFERLTVVYGTQFTKHWPNALIPTVKDKWAWELREFTLRPEAITHGLDNLPTGSAPMVLEFRDICRAHGRRDSRQDEHEPADRETALAALASFKRPEVSSDPRAWARRLRQRELMGERLTLYQRDAWRVALGPGNP
jgi:hypothetical protein